MVGLNSGAGRVLSLKHINSYVKIGDPTLQIFTHRGGSWNASTAINNASLCITNQFSWKSGKTLRLLLV